MSKLGSPMLRGSCQLLLVYPVQWQFVVEDVRSFRQVILGRSHDKVKVLWACPGTSYMHQAAVSARLFSDPSCNRFISPSGGNHQVWPGWAQFIGLRSLQTKKGDFQQPVGDQLQRDVFHVFFDPAPAKRLGECQNLVIVSRLLSKQCPDNRCVAGFFF